MSNQSGYADRDFMPGYLRLRLEWFTTVDITTKTTSLSTSLYLISLSNLAVYATGNNSGSIASGLIEEGEYGEENEVEVNTSNFSASSALTAGQKKHLHTIVRTIPSGNAFIRGTFNFNVTIGTTYYGVQQVNLRTQIDAPPMQSAVTLSATTVPLNSAVTINLYRMTTNTHHTLYAILSDNSRINIAENVTTSASWTLPSSLANLIPNALSGGLRIWADTYMADNTYIGSSSVELTYTIPDNDDTYRPSVSGITITEATAGIAAQFNAFIQSRSTWRIDFSDAGAYGSTINKRVITVGATGEIFATKPLTTKPLANSGTQTVTITVMDSRGRERTYSVTRTVIAYSAPQITTFLVDRSQDNGTIAVVSHAASITNVNGNSATFYLRYKLTTASAWTSINISGGWSLTGTRNVGGLDADAAYDFRLDIYDFFSSLQRNVNLSPAQYVLEMTADGSGIAVGKDAVNDEFGVSGDMPLTVYNANNTAKAKITYEGDEIRTNAPRGVRTLTYYDGQSLPDGPNIVWVRGQRRKWENGDMEHLVVFDFAHSAAVGTWQTSNWIMLTGDNAYVNTPWSSISIANDTPYPNTVSDVLLEVGATYMAVRARRSANEGQHIVVAIHLKGRWK